MLDVNDLKLTDAGGELSADLSGLINDADADPTNELNVSVSFNSGNNQVSRAMMNRAIAARGSGSPESPSSFLMAFSTRALAISLALGIPCIRT